MTDSSDDVSGVTSQIEELDATLGTNNGTVPVGSIVTLPVGTLVRIVSVPNDYYVHINCANVESSCINQTINDLMVNTYHGTDPRDGIHSNNYSEFWRVPYDFDIGRFGEDIFPNLNGATLDIIVIKDNDHVRRYCP